MTVLNYYNNLIDNESEESEIQKIRSELKNILNIQNNLGNTILHECALNDRQTLLDRIRRTGLVDESLLNKDGKTARDIENF